MPKLKINEIFKQAIKHHKNKSFAKAKNFYKKALNIDPLNIDAHNNLGIVLKELGKINEAIKSFKEVLKINSKNIYGHYNLGLAYKKIFNHKNAILSFSQVIKIDPNHYSAFNNLGIVFREIGELKKAKECYEKAIKIKPDHVNSYYNLGNTLFDLRKFDEAKVVYEKALILKPKDKYLYHMIAALTGKTTKTAPNDYVENVFDNFANKFDSYLTNNLKYRVPENLLKLLKENCTGTLKFKNVIDIGCGTGLSGLAFRNISKHLIGVDISSKMILKAQEKKIYDQIFKDEASSFLKKTPQKFDLFISTDVFIYVGDLDEIFSIISTKSNINAKFCFSIEKNVGEDFKLLKSARYSHSKRYIEHLAKKYDFNIVAFKKTNIRLELINSLEGYLFLLSKV